MPVGSPRSGSRRAAVALPLCLVLLASSHGHVAPAARTALPTLVLWAWERPEDLRAIDPSVGVAFLAQTITIADARIATAPRRQPLRVHADAALIAVTRVESAAPQLDRDLIPEISRRIAATAALPRVAGVQIDFDATASERDFYRHLLRAVRAAIPEAVPLSMTALASWCAGDRWLDDLPIDEAVPMLFRMGAIDEPYRGLARAASAHRRCGSAVGVSIDEPLRVRAAGRRVYVFNNRSWTEAAVAQVRTQIAR
jgi:hypothetical protein